MKLNPQLATILAPAYEPCQEFKRACTEMRWIPDRGHVPRGFFGAVGEISEVELVLVSAEPGDPHERESHTGIQSAYDYAGSGFRDGKDLFHRNVLKILEICWPGLPFEKKMRKVWLANSVLCSARKEGGSVSVAASRACGRHYLLAQLALFPSALVVALGSKAKSRLRAIGVNDFLPAYAAAPPGCNRKEAMETWQRIAAELKRRNEVKQLA